MISVHKSPEENGWMQLGWLIAWVLNLEPNVGYHARMFERLPQLQGSELLRHLILDGNGNVNTDDDIMMEYEESIGGVLRARLT